MEKADFRKLSSQERHHFRKRAITLIKWGKKQKEVANFFGVRRNTVTDWVRSHKLYGVKSLKDKPKGPKSEGLKLLSKKTGTRDSKNDNSYHARSKTVAR